MPDDAIVEKVAIELAVLSEDHLDKLPELERDKRLAAFKKVVERVKAKPQ